MNTLGSLLDRVRLSRPPERRADSMPRRNASYVDRAAVLRIVDPMRRKPQHPEDISHINDCHEEGFATFDGLHVQVRRQAVAPSRHDRSQIELWANGEN